MTDTAVKTHADFSLPTNVVSKVDVSRLLSELERIDSEMTAAATRAEVGGEGQSLPVFSDQLNEFLRINELSLDDSHYRSELIKEVRLLKEKAPIIHMTFAVTADRESLAKLAEWVRQSIHPQAVIAVGLQPGLVAGVYLRTTNKVHDLSLKSKLAASHGLLIDEMEAIRGGK